MRRILIAATVLAVVTAACGENGVPATTVETSSTMSPTSSVTTSTPVTTTGQAVVTSATTTPGHEFPIEASAWGLSCSDLMRAGWSYPRAVTYWEIEGRPARMDVDEDGIPCETVYPIGELTSQWGDPLPTGLAPGPGSGWIPTTRKAPVTAACCSMNNNGPTSPPLPPQSGPWPDDGPFWVLIGREAGSTDSLEVEIRRWLPCAEQPDRCGPDVFAGDVYADPDTAVIRTLALDDTLTVVIEPIGCTPAGGLAPVPIEGDGAALASLLSRMDAAAALISTDNSTGDIGARGVSDPTFPYGPIPCDELGWVTCYRGPETSYLTHGLDMTTEGNTPAGVYGWWPSLEVVDGAPVLHLWAGQIAG